MSRAGRADRSHDAAAVVTGAGSGIGRAFAAELARRGGRVVCADITLEAAAETAAQIHATGGRALAIGCDVSELDAVQSLATQAAEWFGAEADLLVNNAGVALGGRNVGDLTISEWRWVAGVNLWGPVHGCHVFVPRMRATGRGGIINVCSAASFGAPPGMSAYGVTKAGALALSETLAAEVHGTAIAVTAVCPTFVQTGIARDGRIEGPLGSVADKAMRWGRWSAERVAGASLDANDRGRLYLVPQMHARLAWRAKRYAPASYTRAMGVMHGAVQSRG